MDSQHKEVWQNYRGHTHRRKNYLDFLIGFPPLIDFYLACSFPFLNRSVNKQTLGYKKIFEPRMTKEDTIEQNSDSFVLLSQSCLCMRRYWDPRNPETFYFLRIRHAKIRELTKHERFSFYHAKREQGKCRASTSKSTNGQMGAISILKLYHN